MDFDVESREFNGKWYTDLKAWKVDVQNSSNTIIDSNSIVKNDNFDLKTDEHDTLPF